TCGIFVPATVEMLSGQFSDVVRFYRTKRHLHDGRLLSKKCGYFYIIYLQYIIDNALRIPPIDLKPRKVTLSQINNSGFVFRNEDQSMIKAVAQYPQLFLCEAVVDLILDRNMVEGAFQQSADLGK